MNNFHVLANLVDRLGWVLLHSAWQFALLALLAGAIARALRRNSAATRYGVLVVAMAISVAAPIVTWLLMPGDGPASLANRVEFASLNSLDAVDRGNGATEFASDAMLNRDGGIEFPATARLSSSNASKTWPKVSPQATDIVPPQPSWSERARLIFRPWLGWIVVAWSLGVVMCSARPLLSWRTLRRLRSAGVSPVPNDVAAMLQQTADRLRVRQAVQILQSTLTRVPVVIGYLRPVILLPVSVIAGVPTAQLEAILAHELAHVRRHDFLVNLLQTLVETVFFYHPAVWWLSHRIRVERENCCDDLAVAVIGNRIEYGRALLALVELRGSSTALALGARSGSLKDRVRRLFDRDSAERSVGSVGMVGIGVGLLALVIIAVGVWNSTLADDERTTPGATAKVTKLELRDATSDVVAQIPDADYARPTADDQRATATIPAEAWGEPVDGLRVAIVVRSPAIDKGDRLRYDVVAENVSDHDIRFGATLGVDDWHNYCKTKLVDADGKQVSQQEGTLNRLRPRLIRIWLKPKERSVISSWETGLLKQDEDGQPLARPKGQGGPWYFSVKPGRYSVSAAVELGPSMYSTDPVFKKRTVLSPARGEWSGKLQSGAVPVALFTQPAPADEAAAKQSIVSDLPEINPKSKLLGVWIVEKVVMAGEVMPRGEVPFDLHFENDKLICRFVPPGSDKDRVRKVVVDETKSPATIDITRKIRGKKETVYGIYKLDGDRLWICWLRDSNQQPSENRPTTFDSSDEVRSDLLVLTRKPVPTK